MILSVPVFSNGTKILSKTVANPWAPSASQIVTKFVTTNPTIKLIDKLSNGEQLVASDYLIIQDTLTTMGFPKEVSNVAMKFVKKETITKQDLDVLKTYAQDKQVTPEQVQSWMKDLGFSDKQIKALMDQYK